MDRSDYIGSSDIAAVMGLSRYCTPLQLWAIKTGRLKPDDLSDNEAVEYGTKLEEFVAKEFSEKAGLRVRRAPRKYIDSEYNYMRCQVDRLVEGSDELLECKTASAWKEKEWDGEEIPIEYILQVQWQLMITGRKVGWIAVLIGGQKFRYKRIDADKELIREMRHKAKMFWQMVQDGTPPMAMGDDNYIMVELYPESDEHIQAVEEMNDSIATLMTLKSERKEVDAKVADIEARLKQVIGDNLGIKTSEYICTWKKQARKEYVVPASETRVLRIRKEKRDGDSTGNEGTGKKDGD